ncbi:hypothetical protein GSI_03270 [Ganoderma sinense ZZ0214-1]|uniref:Aminoglycoside phosphotransferase domain-containing protein n=1 Tax=Ganoderma sinense ZZ0214-1 TaxID=1077348 RepID=A0A2G8SL75_9APHY|nr:hypothetical protein GSI_03270 [Ganoderma sinense ZZ0214-1]
MSSWQPPDVCSGISSEVVLPSPTSAADLHGLECLQDCNLKCTSRFSPGVLVKFRWDMEAEVQALQFLSGRLSIRTPRVLHHAPFPEPDATIEAGEWDKGCWYFFMDECPGVPLDKVIGDMSPSELDHIADQLTVVLKEMRACTSTTLGSVSGGPYDNHFMPYPWQPLDAFTSVAEYLEYYRDVFRDFCGPEFVENLFSCFPDGPDVLVHLTHGDLLPKNILVDGSAITAIIDWETAGFYPEFWEYCRMHDPNAMSPEWDRILARVFPGPRREKEIRAVDDILMYLVANNPLFG